MPSPEPPTLAQTHRSALLVVAADAIAAGLDTGTPLEPVLDGFPPELRAIRATFVTLKREGELRGCIGSSNPSRPLVLDVAVNAFGAAFRDPRFPALSQAERAGLEISISVLSEREEMAFASQADLQGQLRPGIDGLLMELDQHRGTLLPSVWAMLPAATFLLQLKRKAGLADDFWSDRIRISRYTAESFSAPSHARN